MSTLYIVATPIGNLKDFSLRAIDVLRAVDVVLCEDTRVTKRLLDRYDIETPTLSYHQHTKIQKTHKIIDLLREGKNLALVSDAGTPGISDPGNKLIQAVFKGGLQTVHVSPIPGASAVSAAASISGFPMDKFLFMGFPPQKKKRKKFFEEVVQSDYPVILYESPHRIIKTLEELKEFDQKLQVVVCRELTKKFETIYRGIISEVIYQVKEDTIKGEFVIITGGCRS